MTRPPDWQTPDAAAQLWVADCLDAMGYLPSGSINCCVTSPPYFGLRDYDVDGQIGVEPTPDEYVAKIVNVFRGVWRVLRDDGTCWLNLGDTYAAQRGGTAMPAETLAGGVSGRGDKAAKRGRESAYLPHRNAASIGLKHKDLIGIPWRVAFALQADGWYLRQDIIWHKPNPMPESVKDRCTKSHEYIFLLTKAARYYFDNQAIMEPAQYGVQHANKTTSWGTNRKHPNKADVHKYAFVGDNHTTSKMPDGSHGRNRRDVWTVTTKPYKGAHFAVFPAELIEPCILAGCPVGGVVLDPFCGSGTTGIVAIKHNRKVVLIELNPTYALDIASPRIKEAWDERRQDMFIGNTPAEIEQPDMMEADR